MNVYESVLQTYSNQVIHLFQKAIIDFNKKLFRKHYFHLDSYLQNNERGKVSFVSNFYDGINDNHVVSIHSYIPGL